ncbi:hypothetical protein ACFZCV_14035 [Streptomyces sp. NPDC007920]|uniref:hypothetical protein n=1 Tax=Streptomyces sp. NPDC007920 TaxID=3364794 RepID=UPI0036E23D13
MAYGADHNATPPPHPDLGPARGCEACLGWGTVVTDDGHHELCVSCQQDADDGPLDTRTPPPRTSGTSTDSAVASFRSQDVVGRERTWADTQ